MSYFLIQFPASSYVVHKSPAKDTFHIFYPCGLPKGKKGKKGDTSDEEGAANGPVAGWLRCKNLKVYCHFAPIPGLKDVFQNAKRRLKKAIKKGAEAYDFYTFEVTSIRKAPKDMLINYRLNQYEVEKPKRPEQFGAYN